MANFCSWCGSPLEPGARYCPECGARVLESVKVDGSADAVDPMRGFDIVDGEAIPADKTAKLDRERDPSDTDTLVLPTDNAQKRFTLEGAPKKSRTALIVCIALIVVLAAVVAVLVAAQVMGGAQSTESVQVTQLQEDSDAQNSDQGSDQGSDQAESQNDASNASQAVVQEPEREEMSDDEVFAALDGAYDRLTGYNDRIGDCVSDFNNLYLARSMDDRTAAKKRADTLLSDLEQELSDLEDLRIEASSPYADDAAGVIELYGCQMGRVQSLVDAWEVDVKYDVPSQHEDEILEVLARNNEGGTNKYLTRYDELYPSAQPQRES